MKRGDFVHVIGPVLLGGLMYVAFRRPELLLFRWAEALGLGPGISALREICAWIPMGGWLLYSLPDALWLYAFAYAMATTWRLDTLEARLWRWLPLALGMGSEAAQALGMLEGTFDVLDALGYAGAFALAAVVAAPRQSEGQPEATT